MNITQFTIKFILLFFLLTAAQIAAANNSRVSCEGDLEKTNVTEVNTFDKKGLKKTMTIIFINDRAIVPGAILSCLNERSKAARVCEYRTLTQFRTLKLERAFLVYKYVDSVKNQTEIFTGYCKFDSDQRAQ